MYIISKSIKGQEYLYSKRFMIECKDEKQSIRIAKHLNENNEKSIGDWKLKDNETWFSHFRDQYDGIEPQYKIVETKNSIKVRLKY